MSDHIPLFSLPSDTPVPLFNISGLRTAEDLWMVDNEQQFVEVEIFRDQLNDDVPLNKSIDDIINMNKYKCYICNIEVPKTHFKEHNNSFKHKTCSSIADISLGRVKKQLEVETFEPRKIEIQDTYFCETCSVVVFDCDRENHEKLQMHKISVSHDRLLYQLLRVYKDINNIRSECDGNIDTVLAGLIKDCLEINADNLNSKIDNQTQVTEKLDVDNEVAEKHVVNESHESELTSISDNIQHSAMQEENNNTIMPTKSNNGSTTKQNLLKYKIKESKNKEDKMKINKVTSKNLDSSRNVDALKHKMQTTKNTVKRNGPSKPLMEYVKTLQEKSDIDVIHTLEAMSETIIKITAINGDIIQVHTNNFHSFHAKRNNILCKVCESQNVQNKSFHKLQEEHMVKIMLPIQDRNGIRQLDDIWSHCIVCNDLIKNVHFHLQSLLHKNKLKHSLVQLGCDKDSDSDGHTSTHMKTSNNAKLTPLIEQHNLTVTDGNNLRCLLCEVIIHYDISSVKLHIKSFEHIANIKKEAEENKLISVDDNYYCLACDVKFLKSTIFNHCNGNKHKKKLEEPQNNSETNGKNLEAVEVINLQSIFQEVKKDYKGKINDSELICFVCNEVLFSLDEHMESFEHKKSYLAYLERNKLNEIEADTFLCIPCNTVITIDYLMSHCTGKRHRLTLRSFSDKTSKNPNVNNDEDLNFVTGNSLLEMKSDNSLVSSVNIYSNISIVNSPIPKGNKMPVTTSQSSKATPLQPLKNRISQNLSVITANEERASTSQSNSASSSMAVMNSSPLQSNFIITNEKKSNKRLPLKILYQFRELCKNTKLLCIICGEEVLFCKKYAEYHVKNLDHVVAFNLLMLWNKIKKGDDKYFCDVCRVDLTYFSEIEHVFHEDHVRNLAKESKGTVYEYDRALLTHDHVMSHKVRNRKSVGAITFYGKVNNV